MIEAVIQNCEQIDKKIKENLKNVSKNQLCKYSLFPKRMWCMELRKLALYGICETCQSYEPRNLNIGIGEPISTERWKE